jgi:FkbM family methyltransferase
VTRSNRRPWTGAAVKMANHLPSAVASVLTSRALTTRFLRPLANAILPIQPSEVVVRSGAAAGLRLIVEPQSEKFYWTGSHEPGVQRALTALLSPGMVFWDVGAHIGYLTLVASRLVASSGKVHAFEPVPKNLARLRTNLELNATTNVAIHDLAIFDREGEFSLHDPGSSLQWTLLADTAVTSTTINVPCTTLDVISQRCDSPHIIKVDVEGAEVAVLRGAKNLLERLRPILIVEFATDQNLAVGEQLLDRYRLEFLDNRNWLALPLA